MLWSRTPFVRVYVGMYACVCMALYLACNVAVGYRVRDRHTTTAEWQDCSKIRYIYQTDLHGEKEYARHWNGQSSSWKVQTGQVSWNAFNLKWKTRDGINIEARLVLVPYETKYFLSLKGDSTVCLKYTWEDFVACDLHANSQWTVFNQVSDDCMLLEENNDGTSPRLSTSKGSTVLWLGRTFGENVLELCDHCEEELHLEPSGDSECPDQLPEMRTARTP
eukprot:TRINITY_DN67768_c0_g1_i1.p1 TRINITY_DN67768_c0_g1~~TRINITY_DN67768_c0_g1_i1.p1  ORF type:complete len:221 (-),score=14.98 TRINITY_DN67768_c0_g1_i1:342-1004(-)